MDKNIMIVKGAVLIPNIPDSVGDVLDEETIRKVSLIFNPSKPNRRATLTSDSWIHTRILHL